MRSKQDRRLKLYRGTWCAVWTERVKDKTTTKRQSLRTCDRAIAERNFQEYLRQLNRPVETISDILDYYFKEKTLKHADAAQRTSKQIRKFFGNLYPDQITRNICKNYRTFRKVSDTTVKNELALLKAAVRFFDPHTKAVFWLPSAAPPRDKYITIDEYRTLLNATGSPHMRLFIILAWGTAARSNAILGLTWSRVDMIKKQINFHRGEKNKRTAFVPMSPKVFEALQEAERGATCDYVIEYGSKQVESVRRGFKDTAMRAGFVKDKKATVSPHVLRHSSARYMAEKGFEMSKISQFLGHTNTKVTESVYARYSPGYLQDMADALDG